MTEVAQRRRSRTRGNGVEQRGGDDPGGVRVGAVGDLHFDGEDRGVLESVAEAAEERCDVLALLGDLTTHGRPEQARVVGEVLGRLSVPTVTVLGNHDWEADEAAAVTEALCDEGIHVLDGDACEVAGVGFAGVKGFAGGFGRGSLGAFGEPLIKRFVQEAVEEALKLENALRKVASPVRVALLHYAPIADTLEGEPETIWPFLGSSRLLPPIDTIGADVVFHGHAHTGRFRGATPGGVPVFNVAYPLLQRRDGEVMHVWRAPAAAGAGEERSDGVRGPGR